MIRREAFRDRKNYWLARGSEAARPLLRGVARLCAPGPAVPASQWRNGLIVGAAHIGDVLYRTASLPYLQKYFPDCRWSYLAGERSAPVLGNNPHLARVLPHVSGTTCDQLRPGALEELRAARFDAVLCTDANTYQSDYRLALRLGIPNRAGFVHRGLSGFATHPAPCPYPSPWPRYFQSMIQFLAGTDETWDLRPRVYPGADDLREAEAEWARCAFDPGVPVIACAVASKSPQALWPVARYLEALRAVQAARPVSLLFCGSTQDADTLREMAAALPGARWTAGLGLRSLVVLLGRCRLFLGSDSGPRHLANAAGIPVFYFRSLGSPPFETASYCAGEVDLSPPGGPWEPARQRAALETVSAESVADKLLRFLTDGKPAARPDR